MKQSRYELKGKTVVVTGASSGVGLATVEAFAKYGANIVLAARGEEGLSKAVEVCRSYNVIGLAVPTDVSKAEEVKNLVDKAKTLNGRIDVWVNNAGVMSSGRFEEIPNEINEQVIKTNLFGYMHGAYYAIPVFKQQGDGILINNISIGGYMPAPFSAVYSATKFGIRGMMEGLRSELTSYDNIHICNLYPQIQRSTGNSHSAKFSGLDFKVPPTADDPKKTAEEIVKLAMKPRFSLFPGLSPKVMKQLYSTFPRLFSAIPTKMLEMNMKLKNAQPTEGNILEPSDSNKIYGETSLPVPSRKTKNVFLGAALAGLLFVILKPKK